MTITGMNTDVFSRTVPGDDVLHYDTTGTSDGWRVFRKRLAGAFQRHSKDLVILSKPLLTI
jgi:hypothetical protein